MNEKNCKISLSKDEEIRTIPLVVFESEMNRMHKLVSRLIMAFAVCIISIVCVFAYMWLQCDYVSTDYTITSDTGTGSEDATAIYNDGNRVIVNGESTSASTQNPEN